MKTLILAALCLALGACATGPEAGEYLTRTEYVAVPCDVRNPAEPAWAVDALPIGAPIDDKMRALRADRVAAKAHIKVQDAALDACRSPPPAGGAVKPPLPAP